MLPKIIMYNIISLDGRMDWVIDSPETLFLYYELSFHWKVDAILMGSGTALALEGNEAEDLAVTMPKPTQKLPYPGTEKLIYEPRPLLVISDSGGRVHNYRLLQAEPWWRDIVVLCSNSTPHSYLEYLNKRQVNYITAGDTQIDFPVALNELNRIYGVDSIRTDSGGVLNGILLRKGLVGEVSVLISPSLIGGQTPHTVFNAPDLTSFDGIQKLKFKYMDKVKDDYVWLRYEVIK